MAEAPFHRRAIWSDRRHSIGAFARSCPSSNARHVNVPRRRGDLSTTRRCGRASGARFVGVHQDAKAAGVVLAGGRSTRMGRPKAALEWHGSTLLYRAAAILSRAVDGPIVVVAAPGQQLPELPVGVDVVEDPIEGQGPMVGVATGLAAVAERAPVAFVCSTDMPFLHPAF